MKKIIYTMATIVFALTFSAAYAVNDTLSNGVTDFTGRSYDTFAIAPADEMNVIESSSAGGLRTDGEAVHADRIFSGKSYDMFEIETAAADSVESGHAGGLREEASAKQPSEVIDTGRSYDTLPMNPALGW